MVTVPLREIIFSNETGFWMYEANVLDPVSDVVKPHSVGGGGIMHKTDIQACMCTLSQVIECCVLHCAASRMFTWTF